MRKTFIKLDSNNVVKDIIEIDDIMRLPDGDQYQETQRIDLGNGMVYIDEGTAPEQPPPVERQVIRELVKIFKELHQDNQITVSPERIAALLEIKESW